MNPIGPLNSTNEITLLQWNCNSINRRKQERLHYLKNKSQRPPHVICLQEILLTANKYFELPDYTIIRKDRPNPAGGVLIAIHSSVAYSPINIVEDLEVLAIKLHTTTTNKPIIIINIYNQPANTIELSFVKNICDLHKDKVITLGDMNAHHTSWKCKNNNKSGEYILNFTMSNRATILNDKIPTHTFYNGTSSNIDISIVTKEMALNTNACVLDNTMGSDHYPIEIKINAKLNPQNKTIIRYNFSKANWFEFKENTSLETEELYDKDI